MDGLMDDGLIQSPANKKKIYFVFLLLLVCISILYRQPKGLGLGNLGISDSLS